MLVALVGVIGVVGGAAIGYFSRLTEFLRNRRLDAYSEFAGTFLATAHAGAALVSAGVQQGDAFFVNLERKDMNAELWESFGAVAQEFEKATARLRLLASESARNEAQTLEDFIRLNIRDVHPVKRGEYPVRLAPSQIDSEAVRLASQFAISAQGEVTRWRRPRQTATWRERRRVRKEAIALAGTKTDAPTIETGRLTD
jgi:hypothetical protein